MPTAEMLDLTQASMKSDHCTECGAMTSLRFEGDFEPTGVIEYPLDNNYGAYWEEDFGDRGGTVCRTCAPALLQEKRSQGYKVGYDIECWHYEGQQKCGTVLGHGFVRLNKNGDPNDPRDFFDFYGGEVAPLGCVYSVLDDRRCQQHTPVGLTAAQGGD